MTIRELFDFIVDPTIADESVDDYLDKVQQKIKARGNEISSEEQIADVVFVQSFIPKTLDEVYNAEEDAFNIGSGKGIGDFYYKTVSGLQHAITTPQTDETQNEGEINKKSNEFTPENGVDSDPSCSSEMVSDSEEDEDDGSSSEGEFEKGTTADKKSARKENKKKVRKRRGSLGRIKFQRLSRRRKRNWPKLRKPGLEKNAGHGQDVWG